MTSIRLKALNAATVLAVAGAAITASGAPVQAKGNDDAWKVIAGAAAAAIAITALTPQQPSYAQPVTRSAPPPEPVYVAPPQQVYVTPQPRWQAPEPVFVQPRGPVYAAPGWENPGWQGGHKKHRRFAPPVYYSQPGWSPWR